jgi:predicted metal-dependent hydrolase
MRHSKRAGLTVAGYYSISLNGKSICYTVKRSPVARNIRFEIKPGNGLTVILPKTYPLMQVPGLVAEKRKWILDRFEKYPEYGTQRPQRELTDGDVIPFLGRELTLHINSGNTVIDGIELEQNVLIVPFSPAMHTLVIKWYRTQAERYINERLPELSRQCGTSYNRVTIRGQKTRWGSCSRKGNLSFNWKLMIAPPEVIDYVIIHELLHRIEMNHSKRFRKLLEYRCPAWREYEKWLRKTSIMLAEEFPF